MGRFAIRWVTLGVMLGAAPAFAQEEPVAGTWDMTFDASMAGQRWTLTLEGSGQSLAGTMDLGPAGATRLQQVVYSGARLRFEFPFEGHRINSVLVFTGRVDGDTYRGEMTGFPGTTRPASFRAKRRPGGALLPPEHLRRR